jgi:hypothetical protein
MEPLPLRSHCDAGFASLANIVNIRKTTPNKSPFRDGRAKMKANRPNSRVGRQLRPALSDDMPGQSHAPGSLVFTSRPIDRFFVSIFTLRRYPPRNSMSEHKFKIGQTLHFSPHRLNARARPGKCRVTRLVSSEGENPQYQIKCDTETYERVVWESELA